MTEKLPSLVIVGRPNVGKSTLFNRLTGTRRSIVTDEPGITRDRIYGRGTWSGRAFEVVDTGGMMPEDKAAIPREICARRTWRSPRRPRSVLVVDARAGVTPLDAELARRLRRTGKPLVVAANKVDTGRRNALAAAFYELGTDVFPVSAEHGTGVDDLLDAVAGDFPVTARRAVPQTEAATKTAKFRWPSLAGQTSGKSTLLNTLAGEERSIVSAEPGTTRDAVDMLVVHDGSGYRFIDTAEFAGRARPSCSPKNSA